MIAIAMVLADIAGDTRRDVKEHERAAASLENMTPKHILEAGLSGDYAEVGIRLLRSRGCVLTRRSGYPSRSAGKGHSA